MAKKNKNLKLMKQSELEKELVSLQEEIRVIRFKMQGAKSKNVKEMKTLKKNVARVLTEMKNFNKEEK